MIIFCILLLLGIAAQNARILSKRVAMRFAVLFGFLFSNLKIKRMKSLECKP